MKVRTWINSCVSLALIPPEDVIMSFDQVCSASESFPQIKYYLEYFEETWLRSLVVLEKEVNQCFQSLFGISSKMREMVTRRPITTLKAGIEPSNWAWDSLTPRLQNSYSICARSRVSLKTAVQEYAHEKFCQSMPNWSVTASVFSNFATIIRTIICCLF